MHYHYIKKYQLITELTYPEYLKRGDLIVINNKLAMVDSVKQETHPEMKIVCTECHYVGDDWGMFHQGFCGQVELYRVKGVRP